MKHWIEILDQDTIPYSHDWSQEIFIVHVSMYSSISYQAFYTARLDCQILATQMLAPQARRWLRPF